ncbi:hypothetical protein [Halobacteriaceae bacterium SHR40]|uniref:hypothetical protein n=1 Tax=Halovenus amylolytica TaxID=2500550 RepID=UPI000FE414E1
MSQTDSPTDEEIRRTVQIPSLLTNSLRAVLDAFGEDIIRLQASGSIETTNGTLLDDLREYGVAWEQQDQQRVTIDYEQLPGADGPVNPLTADAQTDLLEEIETRLAPQDTSVEPDIAVTEFTIRITDDRLQAVTPAHTPEFDLRFVSDPAEPPIRDVTKRYNADRDLYSQLGFEVRNLNLRTVIETETKFHEQADGTCLSWGGPDQIWARVPERLAVRINDHVLPDAYGVLKPYVVTDERVLELGDNVEDVVDPQPFAGETGGNA